MRGPGRTPLSLRSHPELGAKAIYFQGTPGSPLLSLLLNTYPLPTPLPTPTLRPSLKLLHRRLLLPQNEERRAVFASGMRHLADIHLYLYFCYDSGLYEGKLRREATESGRKFVRGLKTRSTLAIPDLISPMYPSADSPPLMFDLSGSIPFPFPLSLAPHRMIAHHEFPSVSEGKWKGRKTWQQASS